MRIAPADADADVGEQPSCAQAVDGGGRHLQPLRRLADRQENHHDPALKPWRRVRNTWNHCDPKNNVIKLIPSGKVSCAATHR